jgi:hypothetical protein
MSGLLLVAWSFAQIVLAHGQNDAPLPTPGITVGSQPVTGATWNLDSDVATADGPWDRVTITNTSCTTPYRPGSAQAGAIIFTALLEPTPSESGAAILQGDLLPFTGSMARGHVQLLTPPGQIPNTRLNVSLFGLEPFAVDNTLFACLTPTSLAVTTEQIALDGAQVVAFGYQPFGVVTTSTPGGDTLIAVAGTRLRSADGSPQWVFFFLGTTYLGTDTAVPSPQLRLAGTPGPGQVDVQYCVDRDESRGPARCCSHQRRYIGQGHHQPAGTRGQVAGWYG